MSSQCSLPTVTTRVCWLAAVCLDRAAIQLNPVWVKSIYQLCVCVLCEWCNHGCCVFWRSSANSCSADVCECSFNWIFSALAAVLPKPLVNSAVITNILPGSEKGEKERVINKINKSEKDLRVCLRKMWFEVGRIPNPSSPSVFRFMWNQTWSEWEQPQDGSAEEGVSFLHRSFSVLLFSDRFALFPTQLIAQQHDKKKKKREWKPGNSNPPRHITAQPGSSDIRQLRSSFHKAWFLFCSCPSHVYHVLNVSRSEVIRLHLQLTPCFFFLQGWRLAAC